MSLPFKIERNIHVYGREMQEQRCAARGLSRRSQADNQALYLCIYFLNAGVGFPNFSDRLI